MDEMSDIKDKAYQQLEEIYQAEGIEDLGLMSSATWKLDPRRLSFVLSRYKFVAKMFESRSNVLEIGCGDGFASRIVRQSVKKLRAADIEKAFIENAKLRAPGSYPIDFLVHDFLKKPLLEAFDAIYALDVIEHIQPDDEDRFLSNIIESLHPDGCLILGAPSLESQIYASPQSKIGHVNCKSGNDFRDYFKKFFHNVFLFSMNDEVVHTGYTKMAHYLFALCTGPK